MLIQGRSGILSSGEKSVCRAARPLGAVSQPGLSQGGPYIIRGILPRPLPPPSSFSIDGAGQIWAGVSAPRHALGRSDRPTQSDRSTGRRAAAGADASRGCWAQRLGGSDSTPGPCQRRRPRWGHLEFRTGLPGPLQARARGSGDSESCSDSALGLGYSCDPGRLQLGLRVRLSAGSVPPVWRFRVRLGLQLQVGLRGSLAVMTSPAPLGRPAGGLPACVFLWSCAAAAG